MPRPPISLRQNASWAFVGNAVYAGAQWLTLVALARLGSPTLVGQFALGLAIGAPAFMLGNLQLRAVLATDARDEHAWGDYLGLRLLTTGAALAAIAAVTLAAGYRTETALVVILIGLSKAIEAVSDLCYGWFQKHERLALSARSLILRGALAPAALIGLLWARAPLSWAVLGMAAVWLGVLCAHDLPAAARLLAGERGAAGARAPLAPRFDRAALTGLARLAWPLGLSMMFLALTHNIPRYFVEHHLGEAGLGIFVAMAYVPLAGEVVVRALGQAATPRLARHHAAGDKAAFDRLLGRLLAAGAALGLAGVAVALAAGAELLALLFGPAYAAHAGVFSWIMVAGALIYLGSLLGHAIAATRAFSRFTGPYAAVAGVALVAAAILVPRAGLAGAAWTLCAVGAATCAASLGILRAVRRPR